MEMKKRLTLELRNKKPDEVGDSQSGWGETLCLLPSSPAPPPKPGLDRLTLGPSLPRTRVRARHVGDCLAHGELGDLGELEGGTLFSSAPRLFFAPKPGPALPPQLGGAPSIHTREGYPSMAPPPEPAPPTNLLCASAVRFYARGWPVGHRRASFFHWVPPPRQGLVFGGGSLWLPPHALEKQRRVIPLTLAADP